MKTEDNKDGLLSGIRILDLADEKAGFCSKVLADLGASVIKVERPGGDPSRNRGPFLKGSPHPEAGLFFHYNNTNKRGITLDPEKDAGRDIFFKLMKITDVVIETFPPGYLEELGLGFEVLSEINPALILVSVTGFGRNGPRSKYKTCDLVASAFGGSMYVSGSLSASPLKPFGEQSYYTVSLYGAVAVLLALRRRAHRGRGEHVDISMQEAVTSTVDHMMVRYFYDRVIPKRQGSLHWDNTFCILPCKDGHILMTLFQQWETLIELMESEGMAEDLAEERWKDEGYRRSHVDHIIRVLERWTKTHATKELFELGQLMHFPWAPVQSPSDVLKNPQLRARDFFVDPDHPDMGKSIEFPGIPYKFSGEFFRKLRRAPRVGEDNKFVYGTELGLSDEEIQKLSSMGVI
ncbi:MAG: CoA transferase [Thermodesulfobacteriota bacterium]|nr:CoA transferase [Thermodesulfobacteriota bacterium]